MRYVLDNPKYKGRLVQTFDGEGVEAEAERLRIVGSTEVEEGR